MNIHVNDIDRTKFSREVVGTEDGPWPGSSLTLRLACGHEVVVASGHVQKAEVCCRCFLNSKLH